MQWEDICRSVKRSALDENTAAAAAKRRPSSVEATEENGPASMVQKELAKASHGGCRGLGTHAAKCRKPRRGDLRGIKAAHSIKAVGQPAESSGGFRNHLAR